MEDSYFVCQDCKDTANARVCERCGSDTLGFVKEQNADAGLLKVLTRNAIELLKRAHQLSEEMEYRIYD